VLGVVAQCFAQAAHCRVDAAFEVNDDAVRPEPPLEFLAGDHLTGMLKQQGQNQEWLVLQPYRGARLTQFCGTKVNLENVEAHHRRGGGRRKQGDAPLWLIHHLLLQKRKVNNRNQQGDTVSLCAVFFHISFLA